MQETKTISRKVPEGALFSLNTKLGQGDDVKMKTVGWVIKNENSQYDSYIIVNADGKAVNADGTLADEGKLGLVIDVSKAGDLYLKAPNPSFNPDQPSDFKVNSRFNIVTTLYTALSKSGEKYFRATIGGKDAPEPKVRYYMFHVNHQGTKKKTGSLG